VSQDNEAMNQKYLEKKKEVKRNANGGQTVGQEMIVKCLIKNQTVFYSQDALKETNVSTITSN